MSDKILCAEELINSIMTEPGRRTYLEIGIRHGDTFCRINAPRKIGIDPIRATVPVKDYLINTFQATYYTKTSDLFFEEKWEIFDDDPIDVAFVDGLHAWEQVLRDVNNCLCHLSDDGVIVLHDCNPMSESAAAPGLTPAARKSVPSFDGSSTWNGDVWKAIVYLRSCRFDLNIFVLDCDYGLGIITKGTPDNMLNIAPVDIPALTYDDLVANREEFLNLKHDWHGRESRNRIKIVTINTPHRIPQKTPHEAGHARKIVELP